MKTHISTDEQKIDELLTRSVDTIYPSKEELKKKLLSGERLTIYMGIDPTSTYAHLGHSTNYLKLKRFHELGHHIVVLIGDFTAMIGDPSDKTSARVRLTKEDVKENVKDFRNQISKILPLDTLENPIDFRFNSEWLSQLTFEEVVDMASYFTVQHMLERDVFERRMKENKPLYVHEFFYPLMQGYDSVALKADIEIGGTDQTFNMLAGRTLSKKFLQKSKFVITTTLFVDPITNEKLMSKSKGTGIGLDETAESMFVKTMNLPDSAIIQAFIDCTLKTNEEIEDINQQLSHGAHPRDIKMKLAEEIVRMYHGENAVAPAQESFINAFQKGGMPLEAPVVTLDKSKDLIQCFIDLGIISSKSDWRRLIDGGGVTNVDTGDVIKEYTPLFEKDINLRLGKKKFVKVEYRD